MKEKVENDIDEISPELFNKALDIVNKKPGCKYQDIRNGGSSYKMALWNLCRTVWESEKIPAKWHESKVIQISKGRGPLNSLASKRHIHDRDEHFKFFGQIVTNIAKETLMEKMTKYQLACKPGHRPSEHLFVIKSMMALNQSNNKGLLMTSFDLKTFFDSEDIFDCMDSLYKRNIKGKIYRLMFNMNENVRVKVKTPVGTTKAGDAGPTVAQGSVDAAIISSNSLDVGVEETFTDMEKEIKYIELPLPLEIYMDDLFRMAETLENAQYGNDAMVDMLNKKRLTLNLDKSCFLVVGNSKATKNVSKRLERKPLTLNGEPMKKVTAIKYLGDSLCSNLQESVHQTVVKRIGLAKHAVYEIRTIMEDCRATSIGAINIAFDIWELSVLPMLLNNSDCWMGISKKTLKILSDLFLLFFRTIFG